MDSGKVVQDVIKTVESQVDAEVDKLDKLTIDDLEKIRKERLVAMKKEAEQKKDWLSKGHGEYTEELEKDFFGITKASKNVVAHFYKSDVPRYKIFDQHLKLLAKKHIEAKFVKLDAEKCPFLTARLNIKVIPSLLIIIDNVSKDKIVGFTDLGNCDDFSTEMLEWRLAHSGVIQYDGDLMTPPEKAKMNQKVKRVEKKTTIRGRSSDDSDSD